MILVLILPKFLHSSKPSRPPGTNQTNLSTRRRLPTHGGRTTNMLVITTSKGMLYWIFCHTTNLGPAVPLDSVLVEGASGLEQRFVGTSSSGHDSNLRTDIGRYGLLATGRQAKASGSFVVIVGDDHGETPGSTRKGTAITHLGFDIANDGTLGNLSQRQHVANGQSGLFSTVDELASVHAFGGHHEFGVAFEAIGIQELNLGHWGTSSGIVKDFLHDTADVASTFGVVNGTELNGPLARASVCLEDWGFTLSLRLSIMIDQLRWSVKRPNYSIHDWKESVVGCYALSTYKLSFVVWHRIVS